MTRAIIALLALIGTAGALSARDEDAKNRPVSKVINMLKDMSAQLEKEGEEDEEIYDKMVCWCETNDKEKTKSIADAEQHLADLTASIEELTAKSARLSTEISNLNKEVTENGQALSTATALRQKELAEFIAEEKDSVQSIAGLKAAIVAISKHQAGLLESSGVLKQIANMVGPDMGKYQAILAGKIAPSQKRKLTGFLQNTASLLQGSSAGKYAPQGGEIWGILTNMKESFEANLADAQKKEADSVAAFQELKAAKEDEIASGTDQKDTKENERADADAKCAADREDHEDTANTLAADQEYLAMLKETCSNMDSQMAERVKTRRDEIAAVGKALAILTDDDAHDTFTSTFNPSFVQRSASGVVAERREKASKLLQSAAMRLKLPKLAALATSVKLDAFTQVKGMIDKMIADLEHEKQDEIDHRDWCIEEFSNTEKTTELKTKDKELLQAKVDSLAETISQLTAAIDTLRAEIAESMVQIKKAGEDRELENKEFQQTVSEQRATQKILTEAVTVLKGFYEKGSKGVALSQKKQEPAGPPPPPGFKSYDDSKGRGPIAMIENIIGEAKALEAEAIRSEEDAQHGYEDMVKETNAAMDAATQDITNKSAAKGRAEGDKAEAEVELEATVSELELLANKNNDIHSSCDFMMKNFDIRQSRRDDEMEALHSAVGILSGAK